MQGVMRIAVKALATAHTPRAADAAVLTAGEYVATDEVHDPCAVGKERTRCRRPIGGRQHIAKRMAGGEIRIAARVIGVQQARELLPHRQVPASATAHLAFGAIVDRADPGAGVGIRRPLPEPARFHCPAQLRRPAHR